MDAARLAGRDVKQLNSVLRKFGHNSLALQLPVGTLVQNDEVIAANMAHKITLGIAMRQGELSHQTNHFIPTPIAILVIERFEIIQIGIAGHKFDTTAQESINMLANRNIARPVSYTHLTLPTKRIV